VSKPGQPFVSTNVGQDVFVVETVYKNKGFRSAIAEIKPSYSEDGTRVTLNVSIVEGLQIFIGSIVVVGNRSVSEATIREQIPLRVGEPFSEAAQLEANNLLRARGIFRRVTVQEEPRLAGETLATVVISVEESPANSVGFGGGLEVARRVRTTEDGTLDDTFDFAPRGFVDLSRRNLGGRNRQVNFFARASLRRRNVPDDPVLDASGLELSEYRVSATFRERLAFNTNTARSSSSGWNAAANVLSAGTVSPKPNPRNPVAVSRIAYDTSLSLVNPQLTIRSVMETTSAASPAR